jgi:hypothetical protein
MYCSRGPEKFSDKGKFIFNSGSVVDRFYCGKESISHHRPRALSKYKKGSVLSFMASVGITAIRGVAVKFRYLGLATRWQKPTEFIVCTPRLGGPSGRFGSGNEYKNFCPHRGVNSIRLDIL